MEGFFCSNCGAKLPGNANFCTYCGKRIYENIYEEDNDYNCAETMILSQQEDDNVETFPEDKTDILNEFSKAPEPPENERFTVLEEDTMAGVIDDATAWEVVAPEILQSFVTTEGSETGTYLDNDASSSKDEKKSDSKPDDDQDENNSKQGNKKKKKIIIWLSGLIVITVLICIWYWTQNIIILMRWLVVFVVVIISIGSIIALNKS